MSYKTDLAHMISEGVDLTEEQKESLMSLVSGRVRAPKRRQLQHKIWHIPLCLWYSYGIFNRVHLEDDGLFIYCAGQDYVSEISTVRQCILGEL